jgi:DNA processing protein
MTSAVTGAEHARLAFYLAFARLRGFGPVRLRKLLDAFGGLEAAWRADAAALFRAGLDGRARQRLLELRGGIDPEGELERLQASGLTAVCWEDAGYPERLRPLDNAPPVLFVRGALSESDRQAVAIVGTRNATPYGRAVTELLAGALARHGITVVSGLARGIDAYAHQAALDAGGRSIAVIACGADRVYPPAHHALARRLSEQGAVVSDYPPGAPAEPANFPPRNRIISGLSAATIVIEADERSGALITAGFAAEHGRDVFAVPGSIFNPGSRGTNRLILDGATPVLNAEMLLDALGLTQTSQQLVFSEVPTASDAERRVMAQLNPEQAVPVDTLIRVLGVPAPEVHTLLAHLELRGCVRSAGPAGYVLRPGITV